MFCPPLVAEPPSTAKKLRGFLGAYRKITKTIPNHSTVLQPFEKLVGGKASKDRITWTPQLLDEFKAVKDSLSTSKPISFPKSSDKLNIYSQWSQSADAIGGRMVI